MSQETNTPHTAPDIHAGEPDSPERRNALEKLALASAWVAPSMVLLLRSRRASAESRPGTPGF